MKNNIKQYRVKYAVLREWVRFKQTVEANPDTAFCIGMVLYFYIKYVVCG